MLFLDSSLLAKRYFHEPGTSGLQERFAAQETMFVSALSYAEILAAFGRKLREQEFTYAQFEQAKKGFALDWTLSLNVLEVDSNTMSAIPDLVRRFVIRAGGAVQLSSALWLRDTLRLVPGLVENGEALVFGAADKPLAAIAAQCGLAVFDSDSA